jgi:hypothetical protein
MKALISIALASFIFFTGTAQAYDLPKIRVDKKIAEKQFKNSSDWSSAENFEKKLKLLLEEKGTLPASSKERINRDKNLVFVGFYKGHAYFLDRYSIKIANNEPDKKSWKQHIFPIGKDISANNSKYTPQRFCLQDGEFYNSLKAKDKISEIPDEEDKNFLAECFKVGYYYTFKKEIDVSKIFDKI